MATSTIYEFCITDTGNNLYSNAAYEALPARGEGVDEGVADRKLYNKTLRQTSLVSAALAEFIADNQSNNISDSLSVSALKSYFLTANYNKTAEDFYTKTASDARYYTQSYMDSNYYTQSYINSNYYTQSTIDANFYTKTASDARYYTQSYIDSNYSTTATLAANYYNKTESDARYYLRLTDLNLQSGAYGSFIKFIQSGVPKSGIGGEGFVLGNSSAELSLFAETGLGISVYTDGSVTRKFRYHPNGDFTFDISSAHVGVGTGSPASNLQIRDLTSGSNGSISGASTLSRAAVNAPAGYSPALTLGYYSAAYGLDVWVSEGGLAPVYFDNRNTDDFIFRTATNTTPINELRISGGNIIAERGNFVGDLTGNCSGNAATSTTSSNVSTVNDSSDTSGFLTFVNNSGTQTSAALKTYTELYYDATINQLSCNIIGESNFANYAEISARVSVGLDTSDTTCFPAFTTSGYGDVPLSVNTNFKYNASTNTLDVNIAAGKITQAALKTTTGEVSTSGALDGNQWPVTKLILPGGEYGFRPLFKSNGTNTTTTVLDIAPVSDYITSSYAACIYMGVSSGSSVVYAQQRYVQASPPYAINNLDYPLFVFCHIKNGKILSVYSAEDPPWAHNGPTNITPDYYRDGLGYKKELIIPEDVKALRSSDFIIYSYALAELKPVEVAVDTDFKNADMGLIPHPFLSAEPNEEIVLCCPDDKITPQVLALKNSGESVASLIHEGYLTLSDELIDVGGLAGGVVCRKLKWKN